MKKIALLFGLMVAFYLGYSQNSKVVSAYNYHNSGKLDKAKANIDDAVENEKTMGKAKTWFYRGNIYIDIYRSQDSVYKNLDPDALEKAYEAYNRALELDEKNVYKIDILTRMPIIAESYFNDGANKYNVGMNALNELDSVGATEAFQNSVNSFEAAYEIYKESGRVDTTTIYYISIASEFSQDYDKAKESLHKLIEWEYPEASIYTSLANIYYKQDKDVEKAMAVYKSGRMKYPEDLNLLLNETNLFLGEGETEKALENLTLAAEIDKTNPTIFFAIGAKYNEIVDDTTRTAEMQEEAFEKAIVAYDKSIELKPDYFDPNYNMGALYVNKAATYIDEANGLPLDAQDEYDELKAKADEMLSTCLPYLETARELQPDDRSTLVSLKEIYTRLKMYDKLKVVNAELEE